MSDVSGATPPPAAAPSAPAPQAAPPAPVDVPVNQTPVDQPRPIGDQAPPKPEGQESNKQSHASRREALQNAFARAKEEQAEAAKNIPKRAKPGMGHNQPPEAMAKEAAKPDKAEQPAERLQRYREGGKFARDPSKPQPEQQQLPLGEQPAQQRPQIKPLADNAPYRDAPKRWSEQTQQEWHATPESVRGAVYNMAREFQGAYAKYKADHDTMEELRPYHDLASKQGTNLRKAFDNYYGMELKLREDLVGGLDVIVQNVARSQGLTGPHGGPLTIQDVAQHIATMSPEQRQLTQQRNLQQSSEQRLGQVQQQVEQQNQVLNQILYQQKYTYTRSQVDQFAESHPRFDELGDLIKSELDLGFSLEQAYRRADRLRPSDATHAAQTRTQSAQTRKTSISGAPDGSGRTGNTRPSDGQRRSANGEAKHPTRREALERAIRRAGNGV
jgi:hypothetical protein